MDAWPQTLSVVIPTYCREQVLLETIGYLAEQSGDTEGVVEILLIDQTPNHEKATEKQLCQWDDAGIVRWHRLEQAHLTRAMNTGLLVAKAEIVLFVDDDIIPGPDLLANHLQVYQNWPGIMAVVGQILQPGEEPEDIEYAPHGGMLRRFMDFPFKSTRATFVENAMAGNFSMVRKKAVQLGGFDERFIPPVASRFESEFAKRIIRSRQKIRFEPTASIRHLQVQTGGTRTKGTHLASMSPRYGVGDYYFALCQGAGWERVWYVIKKPFREVRTKFHLLHPWWIPVKLVGECRAFIQAIFLLKKGPLYLQIADDCKRREGL